MVQKTTEELRKLTDVELIQRYQSEEFTKKEAWSALLNRYLELIKGLFYKRFAWLDSQKTDLFDSTFKLAMEKEILKEWHPGGLSVKNWIVQNLVYWLPGDTEFSKQFKEQEEHWEYKPEEDFEHITRDIPSHTGVRENQQSKMSSFLKKLEEQAMDFLEVALNDTESTLMRKRKKSRRLVLKTLKNNYEKDGTKGIKIDREKAGEVDMTKNSFSIRKVRALDDLVEEIEKRSFPCEIIPTFSWILNFRVDSLASRAEELKENS